MMPTPRTLVPSPRSLPWENLISGRCYKFTLRHWACEKLHHEYPLHAVFVGLGSIGRGEQLYIDVMFPGGRWTRIYRAQVVMVEDV